ncbi:MAG TPA: SusD/RagB family nutrient-binding outer membrane lipoprotein [Bacteroidales bacterium]|nr:SusD/RagB family nutrient-binding outer membrane lipoprotein [Bacteroidales bacterium]
MKRYILKLGILAVFSAFILTSCTESFPEVNTDPDRAKDAPATNVLAFTLRYYGSTFFDPWADMNELSTYAGYLTKIQYIDEARYNFRPGVVENHWYYGYILLNNINEIKKKAIADGADNLLGVAKVMEVLIVQNMTDRWRDIPYSDAIKMAEGVLLPTYDTQEQIYPALLAVLAEANTLLSTPAAADQLGDGDLLYHGSVKAWQKLANSLRLRLAMRISGVAPDVAKQVVETILGNPAANPVMTANKDNAMIVWPGTSPYEEPWYADSKGRDDHGVSDVLVDALKDLEDPRLPVYALPATADGEYRGFIIGALAQPSLPTISRIGTRFRKDPAGFSPVFRYAEVEFCIAEAAKKGWATGTTTQEAYEAGVRASLEENGIDNADIEAYLTTGKGKFEDTFEQIYWQQWIALYKQGMEGWSLYRRTGVPTTHYVAPGSPYPGHNAPPFRYPYPDNEGTLNGANSKTFRDQVVDNFWGKQMWFDQRTGLQ